MTNESQPLGLDGVERIQVWSPKPNDVLFFRARPGADLNAIVAALKIGLCDKLKRTGIPVEVVVVDHSLELLEVKQGGPR